MTVRRLGTQFRVREDLSSSITPTVTVQKDVSHPHGEWKPAKWLPIVFKKSDAKAGEDAFVISSGKVVAFDAENKIVPAGLRAALNAGSAALVYTEDDYNWGVTDLVTGAPVASSSGASYSTTQIATALVDRGLVPAAAMASGNEYPQDATDREEVIQYFISEAIGVILYDVHVWSGRPEDGDEVFTNYSKQHGVQFATDLQMKVPHRAVATAGTRSFAAASITVVTSQPNDGELPSSGEVWSETALDDVKRWGSVVDGMSVVALQLSQNFVCKNTDRTPITCSVDDVLVNEKSELALVKKDGDFWVDTRTGTVFIHSTTWARQVSGTVTFTITFYYYAPHASGANSDKFVFFDGEARPGAFLSYDSSSNFVEMGSAGDALGTSNTRSIARLINVDVEPKDLLDKVKTGWNLTGMSAVSKMPGSATKGFSDLITLATAEKVADQIAIINLKVN